MLSELLNIGLQIKRFWIDAPWKVSHLERRKSCFSSGLTRYIRAHGQR